MTTTPPTVNAATRLAAGIAGAPGMEDPYERLKELTRGRRVDGPAMREFVAGLGLPDDVAVLMIHLINPWGTAWMRRVNEDNIDLNRNYPFEWGNWGGSLANSSAFYISVSRGV